MNITIKNLKHSEFASQETHCMQATLYVDGKKRCVVSNDGQGGCTNFDGDVADVEKWVKENSDWTLYVDGEFKKVPANTPDASPDNLECVIGHLVNAALAEKDLKRLLKSKVVTTAADGKVYTYKPRNKANLAAVAVSVGEKNPTETVLNLLDFKEALALYLAAA